MWRQEMMDNFNVLAFHFVMHVLQRSRGPADRGLLSRVPTVFRYGEALPWLLPFTRGT